VQLRKAPKRVSVVVKAEVIFVLQRYTPRKKLNLSAEEILIELGLTPDSVLGAINYGVTWAVPNVILGSMVILPVWLVVYLFRPPRN